LEFFIFYNSLEAATVMRDDLDKFIENVKISLKGGNLLGETFNKFK